MTDVPADPTSPSEVLRAAYTAFADVVRPLEDEESWRPTGCTGWAVRDLILHCGADCRRALVALHTPAAGPADRDAVTYWQDWRPDPVGAANGRRWRRVSASMFLDFRQLRELYLETAAATVTAVVRATLDGLLGRPVPVAWSDQHYARAATGRAPLTDADRRALGADAERIPLFS